MMSAGWWRGVLWLMLVGLGLYVSMHITGTLTVFGLGFVIAYLLNSPVEKITGQKLGPIKSLSRGQAILAVYLFLFALLTAGGFLIIPLAIEQTQEMVRDAPEMVARIQTKALELQERYINSVPASVRSSVESTIAGSADRFGSMLGTVFSFLASAVLDLVGKVFLLLTGLLVALYFLLNWHGLFDSALGLVPRKYKDDARSLTLQMNRIFGGYIRATIVASSACGVLTFILLMFLTGWHPNPYSLLLALLAALTYPIPVVGAAGTCVLGGVMAFLSTGDLGYAVVVLLAIMGANQGVDRTIYPKLMGDAIGVSPMFILFAAFAGGEFLGTTGMLLGIPLAAMTKALLTWVHSRFLVVPDEQQRHTTEELWRRAAAKAGQPAPEKKDESAWEEAAAVEPAASSAEVAASAGGVGSAERASTWSPAAPTGVPVAPTPAVEVSESASAVVPVAPTPAVEVSESASAVVPVAPTPSVEQVSESASADAPVAPTPSVEQVSESASADAPAAPTPAVEQVSESASVDSPVAPTPAVEQVSGPAPSVETAVRDTSAGLAAAASSLAPEPAVMGESASMGPQPSARASGPAGQAAASKRSRRSKKDPVPSSEPPGEEEGGIVGMIG